VEGLPLEEAAADIRNNGRLEELSLELVSRIVASLPLEDIAEYIVNDVKLAEVMGEVYEDFVDDLPFAEAGQLIEEDRRLINIVIESLPEISLSEVAEIIRHDDRLLRALADAAAGLPVEKVVEFIQDESRADLIGYIVARTLLNLVADFVADERLALFLHGVLLDAAASLESSPGTLLLDSLARFIENEDSAGYLANSLYELTYGVDYELWNLYKEVVPNFFTRAVWKFI
ncbi:MAG TPA: hypothetical protein PLY40_09180, partial [Bacillota bacterium]|nr:hypothetical protein [Bacillota bacterium]